MTQYLISTLEFACIAVEEETSMTISRCSEDVSTGKLVTAQFGISTVYFYSSINRLIKILDAHDNGDVTGIPAEVKGFCEPETVTCAIGDGCDNCTFEA